MVARLVAALGALAAGVAWAVVGSAEPDVLVPLGLLALAGGAAALAFPRVAARPWRWALAFVALSALPGTTAVRLSAIAGSFEPYSINWTQQDLSDFYLPFGSEGTFDPRFPPRRIVNLSIDGEILVAGRAVTLADLRGELARRGNAPVRLRVDRDAPWLHVAWLLDQMDDAQVRLGATKYAWNDSAWGGHGSAGQPGVVVRHGDWPEVELAAPTRAVSPGPRLRIVSGEAGEPGGGWRSSVVGVPGSVRYDLDGRVAEDFAQLTAWLRERPPAVVEPDARVPWKYVVAVLNEFARMGAAPPALVTPRAPMEAEMRAARLVRPR